MTETQVREMILINSTLRKEGRQPVLSLSSALSSSFLHLFSLSLNSEDKLMLQCYCSGPTKDVHQCCVYQKEWGQSGSKHVPNSTVLKFYGFWECLPHVDFHVWKEWRALTAVTSLSVWHKDPPPPSLNGPGTSEELRRRTTSQSLQPILSLVGGQQNTMNQ